MVDIINCLLDDVKHFLNSIFGTAPVQVSVRSGPLPYVIASVRSARRAWTASSGAFDPDISHPMRILDAASRTPAATPDCWPAANACLTMWSARCAHVASDNAAAEVRAAQADRPHVVPSV